MSGPLAQLVERHVDDVKVVSYLTWTNFLIFYYDPSIVFTINFSLSGSFLEGCEELKSQRDLLAAVQKLLDIPPTPYTELDQTEQDLSYLRALYGNYQHFIDFDKRSVCISMY